MTEREILALIVLVLLPLRWAELFTLRRKGPTGKVRGRWTTVGIYAVGSSIWMLASAETLLQTGEIFWWVTGLGAGAYVTRILIKAWAVRVLGRAWSTQVETQEDQTLVRDGPYAWVRHPIYLCNMMELIAISLIANAPIAGVCTILLLWPISLIRLRMEEKALLELFGEAYREYMREVPALLPLPRSQARNRSKVITPQ